MRFAERVRVLREKRGLSLRKLAQACGLTHATISRIESGQVKQLKSEALKRLAKALGATVDFMVGITPDLTSGDVIKTDPEAFHLVEKIHGLTFTHRQQVIEFVDFLATQEKQGDQRGRKSEGKQRRPRRVQKKKVESPLDEEIPRILPNSGE